MTVMGGEILILLALVAVAVFLVGGFGGRRFPGGEKRSGPDAREILAQRFARGEISEEEFEERKQVLERASP